MALPSRMLFLLCNSRITYVAGRKQETSSVLAYFKECMKINAGDKQLLEFQINEAFMLKGNKALDGDDVELLPTFFK